jgi:transposase-like protein
MSHVPPFYCPYCGEEDIRPFGERHGDWRCAACRRVWTLRYVGVARPGTQTADPAAETAPDAAGIPAPVPGLAQT